MTKALEITDDNFDSTLQSHPLVLVDFWAPWCPPCQRIAPIIDELANDYAGSITIGKLDVDKNPAMAIKYGIKSIPTLIVFKNGEVVEQIMGVNDKAGLQERLDTHV
ncbi:MAG: thioredoxin [Bacteroidota bacterium]